jgi:pimeloyl-ACP methyl ester carboxylesterase
MASFSLVHGAWHGGWAWDLVREQLEAQGHVVHTPDLPCEDVAAGVEEYAAVVPSADVVVGHSLGGYVIPHVEASLRIFLCALYGPPADDTFVPGFGTARTRDDRGRSYYPDPADAARELQYPPEHAHLAAKLRHQAPLQMDAMCAEGVYVVCTRDASINPEWQRRAPFRQVELDAGHSPMLECPGELAELLDQAARRSSST